ncbi:DUF397 domain-containing protein [Micromonospora sp. KC213]|uniref:DUF397 domain-containing protein n=1 Tax=Micromonospora sp. KC213 TaxID=2530378 RepID=UPI00104B7D49|nr:DUF397 domain-containing protein [Micromonospora sp. KC213]TDC40027.1 DUF397 domain-containing protein [Micromonospora sp. KC213]
MSRDFLNHVVWRKSSRSLNENAQCVEVALTPHAVGIRDSRDPAGPALMVDAAGWTMFIGAIKHHGFRPGT